MSLKAAAVIGSTTRRIATWELNTGAAPYFGEIKSLSSFKISHSKRHGGYWKPSFGSIEILQTAFVGNWPPPATITLPLKFETDSGDIDIIDATGVLAGIGLTTVEYDVYGPDDYDTTTDAGTTASNDTLVDYFTWACHADRLNLTLDSTKANDYDISFTLSSDKQIIDVLDQLAYDCNHAFYIDGSTLYLLDLTENNGTSALTEFDFIEAVYEAPVPYSLFKGGDFSVAGTYPQGKEYSISHFFHSTQANVEAQLTRTKTLLDKWWITVKMPIGENDIAYGERLTWTDESRYLDLDISMNAREFSYQLDAGRELLVIEGEGTVTYGS
jgi:hypothetical protein